MNLKKLFGSLKKLFGFEKQAQPQDNLIVHVPALEIEVRLLREALVAALAATVHQAQDAQALAAAPQARGSETELLRAALDVAPNLHQVLARPHAYAEWYEGRRREALCL